MLLDVCICVHLHLHLSEDVRVCMCACVYISNVLCSHLWISLPKWNTVPEAFPCSTIYDGSLSSITSKFLALSLGIFCHLTPTHLPPFPSHSFCHRKMQLLVLFMPICTLKSAPWEVKNPFFGTSSHPHYPRPTHTSFAGRLPSYLKLAAVSHVLSASVLHLSFL